MTIETGGQSAKAVSAVRAQFYIVLACAIGAVAFALALIGAAALRGISSGVLLRDPAVSFEYPAYGGALSHLGIGFLIAAAAITGFAASISRNDRIMLASVALLSAILAFDDLTMLHERLGPELLGIPQNVFFVVYGAAVLAVLAKLSSGSDRSRNAGIYIAVALMGVSVGTDVLSHLGIRAGLLVENLSKLAAFAAWLAFWSLYAARDLRET